MASVNKVFLMGHLARDVELRTTTTGFQIAAFTIATNRKYKVNDQMREEVTFTPVEVLGSQAATCAQYLAKGRGVHVEGRLQLDSWEKDGKKHYKLKVVAERVQFMPQARQAQSTEPKGTE